MATKVWKETPTDTAWSTATNWVGDAAPGAADDVIVNAGSAAIAGSDETGTALNSATFGVNHTGNVATTGSHLLLDTAKLNYAAETNNQTAFIDVQNGGANAKVECRITGTGSTASPTTEGLHLKSRNTDEIDPLIMRGGFVTIGGSSELVTVHVYGGELRLGTSLTGLTTINNNGASVLEVDTAVTTINQIAGNLEHLTGAVTTLNIYGGTAVWSSTGTLTLFELWGGTFDLSDAKETFTITNGNVHGGTLNGLAGIPLTLTNPIAKLNPAATILDDFSLLTIASEFI